jgi:hypothetical protein
MPVLIVLARDADEGNLVTPEAPLLRAAQRAEECWQTAGCKPASLVCWLNEKQ